MTGVMSVIITTEYAMHWQGMSAGTALLWKYNFQIYASKQKTEH